MIGSHRNDQGFKRRSVSPGSTAALRLPGVEGWRGIAALLVVGTHVWTNMGTDGSGLGPGLADPVVAWFFGNIDIVVDLFFVLSGLLLWLPFARAALDDAARVPDGRDFLYRRVLRFIPLYWLVVLVVWFARNYGIATADWGDLAQHLALVHAFDSDRIFYTIGPAWTLSVEWMFYLSLCFVGPAFVRWVREGGAVAHRLGRMFGAFAVVVWISIMFKANVAAVWQIPVDHWAWRYGPVAKADTFVVGMVLATVVVLMGRRKLPGALLPAFVVGGIALYLPVAVPPGADHNLHFEVVRHTVASTGFALVLFGLISTRWTRVPALVDNRVLVRISILTYAIYLLHEPVLLAVMSLGLYSLQPTVAAFALNLIWLLVLVVPVAWVLHRLVEEPWTDLGALRDRQGRRVELYPDLVRVRVPDVDLRSAGGGRVHATLRDQVLAPLVDPIPMPASSPGRHRRGDVPAETEVAA